MCKLIAELTGLEKDTARDILTRLEQHAALPGVDVRFTSEVCTKVHLKMRSLGLDPTDTTPRELYRALYNLAVLHDNFLARRLGIKRQDNVNHVARAVTEYLTEANLPKSAFAIKLVAARQLLRHMPPKQLMKALHYRSVDSLLKRESPLRVLTLARHLEPAHWQSRFILSYKRLSANDFETRDIKIVYLEDKHWQLVGEELARARHNHVFHAVETAEITMLPAKDIHRAGLTLSSMLLVLHYINEIRELSTYFKFSRMQAQLGARFAEQIGQGRENHLKMAGQAVHWRVLHRYYGSTASQEHPEIFEPHVQSEDVAYRKAEETLYRLEPALHFWHELDYVGLSTQDGPLSFNLTDMALNVVNNLSYDYRLTYHMRDSVWNELYLRYAQHPPIERQLLNHLEEQTANRPFSIIPDIAERTALEPTISFADLLIIETPVRSKRPVTQKVDPRRIAREMELVW